MPADTSAAVRDKVGARGFSAYVAHAVERALERDALDEALARMEAKQGPVNEDDVAALMERLAKPAPGHTPPT